MAGYTAAMTPHDDDDDAPPAPVGQKNYITPAGHARLRAELHQLLRVERPQVVEIVSWAAGNGDRSENGDYLYGKKRLREIDRRARFLGKRLEIAEVVDPSAQTNRDPARRRRSRHQARRSQSAFADRQSAAARAGGRRGAAADPLRLGGGGGVGDRLSSAYAITLIAPSPAASSASRSASGSATHPSVGAKSGRATCRKIADPAPRSTGASFQPSTPIRS